VVNVAEAYAFCQRFVKSHYENFPVASHLLPPAMRPHIAAIYAFARIADDIADEGSAPQSERLARLDDWGRRLQACTAERGLSATSDFDAVFLALSHSIHDCRLPVALFDDLLSAFRQDVTTTRYASWEDLLDYCRRSANPVGRLVLRVAGHDDPALDEASDAVCTALQVTNFLQDVEKDWHKGRVYMPLDELKRAGARLDDIASRVLTPEWQSVLALVAGRTRTLFDAGRPVCDGVKGRLRFELRLTWLGGCHILDRLERVGYDVINSRPSIGVGDMVTLSKRALKWRTVARPS
jgi:phytoene synthase